MLALIGTAIGGLGLFLLAMSMISDGLKIAAGGALRDVLARSTATRWRGVVSGIAVTGVVQSSSAVTVATIGFVNAGLLTLTQALGVIYGANVGTTVTGWLVAAIGFKFKVEAFALPLIGIGMFARLLGTSTRIGALGEALAGFGLFFVGIDVLRGAFEAFAADIDVAAIAASGWLSSLVYLGFGFLMTLLTQSSSAAIAITLTAANGGVLALDAAASMVIGANLGTTSTAAFAVIGATPNARRIAAAHVLFNLLTGLVAIAMLPLLLAASRMTASALQLATAPAIILALFHTVFNVMGVLLMWPLTERLARFLRGRFRTTAETLSQPLYIDTNVMATPNLALDALKLELIRMAALGRRHAGEALTHAGAVAAHGLHEQQHALAELSGAVERFVARLGRGRLANELAGRLPNALRINGYIAEVATLAQSFAQHAADMRRIQHGHVGVEVGAFIRSAAELVRRSDPASPEFDSDGLVADYRQLRVQWHDLKAVLLEAATEDAIPVTHLNAGLEGLRAALRIAEQTVKAGRRLRSFEDAPQPLGEQDMAANPDDAAAPTRVPLDAA